MNKILLDNESIINLNIIEESIIELENSNINELNITLNNNASLIINEYSLIKRDFKINVYQYNNSSFIYDLKFKTNNIFKLKININLVGNESYNKINIHGLNDGGLCDIFINGKVYENTLENELYENVKIINKNDAKSNVYPNVLVDSKNVTALHATSIAPINEDFIFYLESKGIERNKAEELLINGFLN